MVKENLLIVGRPQLRRAIARRGFSPGDEIARCPVVVIPHSEKRILKRTQLWGRMFHIEADGVVFPLGYGALCLPFGLKTRHRNALATYRVDAKTLVIRCTAPIARGEKILCSRWAPSKIDGSPLAVSNGKVEVRNRPGRGRGLFALRSYTPRTVIERFPVLVIPSNDTPLVDETILLEYTYEWGYGNSAMPLGFWGLHNTSKDAQTTNAGYRHSYRDRTLSVYCRTRIERGDEIEVPYDSDSFTDMEHELV